MGWASEKHRSTLAAPADAEPVRPPAGALLYCRPEGPRNDSPGATARDRYTDSAPVTAPQGVRATVGVARIGAHATGSGSET